MEPTDQPPPAAEGALDLSAAMAAAQVRNAHGPPPRRWLISTAGEADRRMRAYDLRYVREGVCSGFGSVWGVHIRHERGPVGPGFGNDPPACGAPERSHATLRIRCRCSPQLHSRSPGVQGLNPRERDPYSRCRKGTTFVGPLGSRCIQRMCAGACVRGRRLLPPPPLLNPEPLNVSRRADAAVLRGQRLKAGGCVQTWGGHEAPCQCIDIATASSVHVPFSAPWMIVLRTVAGVVYPRLCSSWKRGDAFQKPLVGGDALWWPAQTQTERGGIKPHTVTAANDASGSRVHVPRVWIHAVQSGFVWGCFSSGGGVLYTFTLSRAVGRPLVPGCAVAASFQPRSVERDGDDRLTHTHANAVAQAAAAALNATLTAEASGEPTDAAAPGAAATPEETAAEERRRKRKSRWGPSDDGGAAAAAGGLPGPPAAAAGAGGEGEPRKRKSRWAAEEPQQSMALATINQGALMLPGGLQVQLPGSMLMATGQVYTHSITVYILTSFPRPNLFTLSLESR